MAEINVGLIGYGMAARVFHAPLIQTVDGLRLKKVVERNGNDSGELCPPVERVRDASALFRDKEIDLVVITTPNSSHFELARQALLAYKHVVVEKPFTTTSGQAQELIDLARAQNRIISVNQNRRWDGDFQTVRRLLDSKLLGRLVEFESHYDRFRNSPRPNAWREQEVEGSGILYDLGSHLIDQSQVLFGLPEMITSDLRIQRDFAKTTDNFELILHYDELKVTLKGGMLVREQGPRFILHGTLGSYVKHGFDPQEQALKQGGMPSEEGWGREPKEIWGKFFTEAGGLNLEGRIETIAGGYDSFYRNIVETIGGRAELAVKPEEARNTIRIIELAVESSAQKRSLPFSF
ncbi:MAG TPA: oxidoreductase [Blastocatellia bacterium]|nr:oxidoreductase [Blastocatellia bacterium]